MTLQTQIPRVVITGNGGLGPYSLVDSNGQGIRFVSTSHVKLTRYAATTSETGTELVLNTDYSVGGTQDARTFTLIGSQAVLTSSQRVVAERNQTYVQELDLTTGGGFNAEAVETRQDKVGEYLQEVKTLLARKLEASPLDATPSTIPLKANATEGDVLVYDADKNLIPASLTELDISAAALGSGWASVLQLPAAGILDNLAGIRFVSTYAALTALTTATGLSDNSIYCTYGRAAEEDGGFGFWRYDSGSSTTANGGTVLAIDGGGAGRFFRLMTDEKEYHVRWFGNLLTGFTAALQACITAAGTYSRILIPYIAPASGWLLTSTTTLLTGQTLVGVGGSQVQITKGFAGTTFDCSAAYCGMDNIQLNGVGATYSNTTTDKGIVFTSGSNGYQRFIKCAVVDFAGPCAHYTVSNAGYSSHWDDCLLFRTNLSNPAVVMPASGQSDSFAGHREFNHCEAGGGCLVAFNNSQATKVFGGAPTTLDFSGSGGFSVAASIVGCRIAGATTFDGGDIALSGVVFGSAVTLAATSARISAAGCVFNGGITDNSTATGDNTNRIYGYDATFTPVWKGDSADPTIGDGSLSGRIHIDGRSIRVDISLVSGSTTTFGTGALYFELPSPFGGWVAKVTANGAERLVDNGTSVQTASCYMDSGTDKIYSFPYTSGALISGTVPFTWTNLDQQYLTLVFEKA